MRAIKYRLRMEGSRPIMLHNVQAASEFNPWAQRMAPLRAKRIKTTDDRRELLHLEWQSSFYWSDEHGGPMLPTANIFKSLIESGRRERGTGKKVEGGVIALDDEVRLDYNGPRTMEGMWNAGSGGFESPFVDLRLVANVRGQKIDTCRPIIAGWSCESDWLIDTSVIDETTFMEVVGRAGSAIGVGAYRLKYGRFNTKLTYL